MVNLFQFLRVMGLRWLVVGCLVVGLTGRAEPVITEFMAANAAGASDEDGAFSDWVEIYNPDAVPVELSGWYLTDSMANKKKWPFPAATLAPGGYLIVWASGKDRRDPGGSLHANFSLSAAGEYLGLIKPDGVTVVAEFAPAFPAQTNDVSFGFPTTAEGLSAEPRYLRQPTPGAANGRARLLETVTISRPSGPFAEAFSLELTGASAGQKIRYVVAAPSPDGASAPEPSATSPEYTGPLAIVSSVVVRAAVFSSDDIVHGMSTTAHYVKLGSSAAVFSSKLPVLVIDNHGEGPLIQDGYDHAAWLYAYNAKTSGVPTFGDTPDVIAPLTVAVRGTSSADFPKKGYSLKFHDAAGNKRPQRLPGFAEAYEKWALVAPWNYDRTYIQNSYIYALSNRIGRWAPRTQMAEMFFNADGGELGTASYAGLVAITDRIEVNPGRLNLRPLAGSDANGAGVTGGYILKIDLQDADELGWITKRGFPDNGDSAVVVAFPKVDELTATQRDYIQNYVQRMEDALYADEAGGWASRTYLDYIDRASWVDHHILNTFSSNLDALVRSAYFTKDRGGKLVAGPVWDFDRAFSSADPRGSAPDVWSIYGGTDFWNCGWWGVLARDPEFMQEWVDRWQQLRRSEFSVGQLTGLADGLAATVGNDAAARDAARWPDNAPRTGDGYAGEIGTFKTWLVARARWIDRQFLAAPDVANEGAGLTFTAPAGALLAYTLDGSDPRSLGGAVAPNAVLTTGPLTLPADANVHVRNYRAELRGAFPGSPWSSAVAGESASPLVPAAKLINLSSRALIGAGQSALIAGVMVADTESKAFLARGVGPTLGAFGVPNTLADPVLGIFRGDGLEIFRNSRWQDGPDADDIPRISRSVGAFALADGSHDAALVSPLRAGAYTMQITSESAQGGVGLAELYSLDGNGRTTNLSTRAMVRSGEGLLVGGFVVQGPAYKRMLIRAVGPALGAFGVDGVLLDPVLKIYSGEKTVADIDDWSVGQQAAVTEAATKALGAFPLVFGGKDAAIFITLPPGAYTVEVGGKNGAEGIALLEIYEVP